MPRSNLQEKIINQIKSLMTIRVGQQLIGGSQLKGQLDSIFLSARTSLWACRDELDSGNFGEVLEKINGIAKESLAEIKSIKFTDAENQNCVEELSVYREKLTDLTNNFTQVYYDWLSQQALIKEAFSNAEAVAKEILTEFTSKRISPDAISSLGALIAAGQESFQSSAFEILIEKVIEQLSRNKLDNRYKTQLKNVFNNMRVAIEGEEEEKEEKDDNETQKMMALLSGSIEALSGFDDAKTIREMVDKFILLLKENRDNAEKEIMADEITPILIKEINKKESSEININGVIYADVLQGVALALAQSIPKNRFDPISLQRIAEENAVYISQRHVFDIYTLARWIREKNQFISPFTRRPFYERDEMHLKAFAVSKEQKLEGESRPKGPEDASELDLQAIQRFHRIDLLDMELSLLNPDNPHQERALRELFDYGLRADHLWDNWHRSDLIDRANGFTQSHADTLIALVQNWQLPLTHALVLVKHLEEWLKVISIVGVDNVEQYCHLQSGKIFNIVLDAYLRYYAQADVGDYIDMMELLPEDQQSLLVTELDNKLTGKGHYLFFTIHPIHRSIDKILEKSPVASRRDMDDFMFALTMWVDQGKGYQLHPNEKFNSIVLALQNEKARLDKKHHPLFDRYIKQFIKRNILAEDEKKEDMSRYGQFFTPLFSNVWATLSMPENDDKIKIYTDNAIFLSSGLAVIDLKKDRINQGGQINLFDPWSNQIIRVLKHYTETLILGIKEFPNDNIAIISTNIDQHDKPKTIQYLVEIINTRSKKIIDIQSFDARHCYGGSGSLYLLSPDRVALNYLERLDESIISIIDTRRNKIIAKFMHPSMNVTNIQALNNGNFAVHDSHYNVTLYDSHFKKLAIFESPLKIACFEDGAVSFAKSNGANPPSFQLCYCPFKGSEKVLCQIEANAVVAALDKDHLVIIKKGKSKIVERENGHTIKEIKTHLNYRQNQIISLCTTWLHQNRGTLPRPGGG